MKRSSVRMLGVALFAGGVVFCAACGGGGGGSSNGPPPINPTPTPTPVPTFTQGPTPGPQCANAEPNPLTEPLVLATPMLFPQASGDCGQIVFPGGSSPVSGNSVTLSTAAMSPPGYPGVIPPGPGNVGIGARSVAPWLTYSLSKTLTTPPNTNPQGQFVFTQLQPPPAFYYVAVFDVTANPNQPLQTFGDLISPFVQTCTATGSGPLSYRRSRRMLIVPLAGGRHRGVRPNDVVGGDAYYFGLFKQSAANVDYGQPQTLSSGGGTLTFPNINGFTMGSVAYPTNSAPSGSQMTSVSSDVDCTNGEVPPIPPPNSYGIPIYYEEFTLTSTASIAFQNSGDTGSVKSSAFVKGASYDIYGYDITNFSQTSQAVLVFHAGPLSAGNGTLTFPSMFNGFTFPSGDTIIYEFVKD